MAINSANTLTDDRIKQLRNIFALLNPINDITGSQLK